jgi:hypothetical protein
MKKSASKLTLIASLFAAVFMMAAPVNAQTAEEKAEKKKKAAEAALKKYDANKNGKLDADEEAKMKADQAKAKEEKKKKN